MKRYIKSSIYNDIIDDIKNKAALKAEFPGEILYHSASDEDDVQIKLSYKTALLFIDGKNVCSLYPKPTQSPDIWVRELKEWCEDYGHPISNERALELATYMITNIKG